MLQHSGPHSVICVLDGLDECEEGSLKPFLRMLKGFFSRKAHISSIEKFKLLVFSRDRPTCIESEFCGFSRVKLDPDSNNEVNNDIIQYVSSKIDELRQEKRLSPVALERVRTSLTKSAEGTFLWVGFVAEELKGKTQLEVEEILRLFRKA